MSKVAPAPPKGTRMVTYSTRNLRLDLLDRVRTLAAMQRVTIEVMMNWVIQEGCGVLEARLMGKRR